MATANCDTVGDAEALREQFEQSNGGLARGLRLWGARLITIPHTLAGLFLISQVLLTFVWMIAGDDTTGRITEAWSEPGKKSTVYRIAYRYKIGPSEYRKEESITESDYDQLPQAIRAAGRLPATARVGDIVPIPLRVLSFGPVEKVEALPPYGSRPILALFGMMVIALFWNAILIGFLNKIWVEPSRAQRKVRLKPKRLAPTIHESA